MAMSANMTGLCPCAAKIGISAAVCHSARSCTPFRIVAGIVKGFQHVHVGHGNRIVEGAGPVGTGVSTHTRKLLSIGGIGGEAHREIVRLRRIVSHRHAGAGHRPSGSRPAQLCWHRDHRISFVEIIIAGRHIAALDGPLRAARLGKWNRRRTRALQRVACRAQLNRF